MRDNKNYNYENRFKWVIQNLEEVKEGSLVLDVGAGGGPFRKYLNHTNYKSQDLVPLDPSQLEEGTYGQIDIVSDIVDIPLSDSSVDVILCTEVLEHVPEPILAIKEFSRLLKTDGVLLLTAPLGSGLHQEPFHFYGGYTPHFYNLYLDKYGLELLEIIPNQGSISHLFQQFYFYTMLFLKSKSKLKMYGMLLFPLAFVLSKTCHLLDVKIDDYRFTVGYFVKARKL